MSVLLNTVKGRLTEGLIAALLEHAGYRVARFGIEQTVEEIRYTRGAKLADLQLPKPLWAMPDLLVVDFEIPAAKPLEVKFRKRFDEATAKGLGAALREQEEFWPDTWAVIFVATPAEGLPGRAYQDYIKVVMPDDVPTLQSPIAARDRWLKLPSLGNAFSRIRETPDFHRELDRLVPVLRALADV